MHLPDLQHALPDWENLARDYLGPDALVRLQNASAKERPDVFAQEWTHMEAVLKCAGWGLREWHHSHAALLAKSSQPLHFSESGWVGRLAHTHTNTHTHT
jgi:4'-phosphopantetheinyl transferase